MTKDKDLKRRVRARMEKTGESYTTARAHLLKKRLPPLADHYESLAGHTDEKVRETTGRTWPEWVRVLDEIGATELSHTEIARHVGGMIDSGWWAQAVTVGYERLRGLRDVGQRRDGGYEVSRSKTIGASIDEIFRAFAEDERRTQWLDVELNVRGTTRNKTVRIDWPDGQNVVVGFQAKGPSKAIASVMHGKLPSRQAAEEAKAFWAERLAALKARLE